MFTVLIAEKEHIEAIREKNKLFFEPFLDNKDLAFCEWNPEGQNLHDSVPGLLDAVGRKKEWRAVILHAVTPDALKSVNPFDVVDNSAVAALTVPSHYLQENENYAVWQKNWENYYDEVAKVKEELFHKALENPLQKLTTWLCFHPEDYILNDVKETQDVKEWALDHLTEDEGNVKPDHFLETLERNQYLRSLQPDIIIDNRADLEQDVWTPEQLQVDEWQRHPETGELVTWEACHTFSGSWGYYRDELTWKSPEQLVAMLVKTVSLGGNLLMNVGPTGRGTFDHRADAALQVYSDWMRLNSRSIYGCTMAEPEFTAPNGCRLTQSVDGKRLYIHLLEYPFQTLQMDCLVGKIEYAQFLHDASEVKFMETVQVVGDKVNNTFMLPVVKPHSIIPVIEIFLK